MPTVEAMAVEAMAVEAMAAMPAPRPIAPSGADIDATVSPATIRPAPGCRIVMPPAGNAVDVVERNDVFLRRSDAARIPERCCVSRLRNGTANRESGHGRQRDNDLVHR